MPSKWSVNIAEIVKRTQKNLERGPSASRMTLEQKSATDADLHFLTQPSKLGIGTMSTKDKNSLLYYDLKKKL